MTEAIAMDDATRASIRYTLDHFGVPEAKDALLALEQGRVDGTTFMDPNGCGCLIGTLTASRLGTSDMGVVDAAIYHVNALGRHKQTLAAQRWFLLINPGDTPATSMFARAAHDVIDEWLSTQVVDLAPSNPLLQPESTRQAIAHLLKEA